MFVLSYIYMHINTVSSVVVVAISNHYVVALVFSSGALAGPKNSDKLLHSQILVKPTLL
jgi:hypothetical protein